MVPLGPFKAFDQALARTGGESTRKTAKMGTASGANGQERPPEGGLLGKLLARAPRRSGSRAPHIAARPSASTSFLPPHGEAIGGGRCRSEGEERFAKQTKWSSGPFRATNAASLGERPGDFAGPASRRAEAHRCGVRRFRRSTGPAHALRAPLLTPSCDGWGSKIKPTAKSLPLRSPPPGPNDCRQSR